MTPASIVPDIPTSFADARGEKKFINYDQHYKGPVTIHHALANSLNVPAVRTLNAIGGLGLTLGSGEVTLMELTNAYASLARMGTYQPVTFFKTNDRLAVTPQSSFWMLAQTMSNNAARTAAFGPHSYLRLPFPCAAKTGTSTDFRDNWCLGFTAEFTVGVWAGNLDNTPMRGISGVTGAGPIFQATMLRLHKNHTPTWFKQPDDMLNCHIHNQTGKRLTQASVDSISLTLPINNTPLPSQPVDYSRDGKILLDARYSDWLASKGDQARFCLTDESNPPIYQNTPLRILSPSREAKYLLDPDLPGHGRQLPLKTDFPGEAIWSSPTLNITNANGKCTATLIPGLHRIDLTDSSGRQTSRSIDVEDL